MRIGLIGKGRAGTALHDALKAAGTCPGWWWSRRDPQSIETLQAVDVVLIAVADRAIVSLAQGLAARPSAKDEIWLHLSGSLPGSACRVSPQVPRASGAMHPLCALDGERDVLSNCVAGIDGEPEACKAAIALASQIRLSPLTLASDDKPLYHAAAVTVAGHAVALFSQAMAMLVACGFREEVASRALLPLMRGAIAKLENRRPAEAMTGPVPRGDACTVAQHLRVIDRMPEETVATYRHLARTSVEVLRPALDTATLHALERVLSDDG